jgi:hypothetical protein
MAPNNLVCLIDVSGSMDEPNKLHLLQQPSACSSTTRFAQGVDVDGTRTEFLQLAEKARSLNRR